MAAIRLGRKETIIFPPATSIYRAQMKETHLDGTRSGRNFALDRQVEPVVMESEISGLPDLHAFMKYENYVTGFSFPYLDMVGNEVAFQPRDLPDDKLTFEPKTLKPKGAAATVAPVIDLEAKPDGKTVAVADQPDKKDLAPVSTVPVSPKDTAKNIAEDEQPIQPTLKF
jgi:hypothetical protein